MVKGKGIFRVFGVRGEGKGEWSEAKLRELRCSHVRSEKRWDLDCFFFFSFFENGERRFKVTKQSREIKQNQSGSEMGFFA